MTARTHETIRVGLRRIIRDQSVKPNTRMDAIRLLMHVEGLMEKPGQPTWPKNKPSTQSPESPIHKRIRELLP